MLQSTVIVRTIPRAVAWLLLMLVAVIVVWFAANRLLDASPSPLQKALLVSTDHHVEDSQNIAVGMLGLTAPKGSDFIQYGVQIKALHAANAPMARIQELVRKSGALRPTVDGRQVTCWLDPDWTVFQDCLPFEKAPAVLAENKELLDRYRTLYTLGHYAAADIYYDDAFLTLVRLVIAQIHLDLRNGKYETAYRKWQKQLRFARGNLRGTDTWVGKAIGLVAIGMTLYPLDSLLVASPNLARVHAAELYELLLPEGIAAYDPEGIVHAEFRFLGKALDRAPISLPEYGMDRSHWLAFHLGQRNRILNRYAAFAPEYAASLWLPWAEIEKESARLRERYVYPGAWEFALDPFGSLFLAEYIEGQLRGREMRRQMHVIDGKLRLAILLVQLINENIRDGDVSRFLANASPEFFDPFTATPAHWDSKDRKIYFLDPRDKCMVESWFRVRDLNRRWRPSSSVVEMTAC